MPDSRICFGAVWEAFMQQLQAAYTSLCFTLPAGAEKTACLDTGGEFESPNSARTILLLPKIKGSWMRVKPKNSWVKKWRGGNLVCLFSSELNIFGTPDVCLQTLAEHKNKNLFHTVSQYASLFWLPVIKKWSITYLSIITTGNIYPNAWFL